MESVLFGEGIFAGVKSAAFCACLARFSRIISSKLFTVKSAFWGGCFDSTVFDNCKVCLNFFEGSISFESQSDKDSSAILELRSFEYVFSVDDVLVLIGVALDNRRFVEVAAEERKLLSDLMLTSAALSE